jgi:hypothetical protein
MCLTVSLCFQYNQYNRILNDCIHCNVLAKGLDFSCVVRDLKRMFYVLCSLVPAGVRGRAFVCVRGEAV